MIGLPVYGPVMSDEEYAVIKADIDAEIAAHKASQVQPEQQEETGPADQYYCGLCGWVDIAVFPNCH